MSADEVREIPEVRFAIDLARSAGGILADRPEQLTISIKSTATDVVTHMDQLTEKHIVDQIELHRPHDGILGEEGAAKVGTSGLEWVIDPLDGTVNYLYNLPFWCVSIALVDAVTRVGEVGAIYAPRLDTLWFAARGQGAYSVSGQRTQRLAVTDCSTLDKALMGTGFGYSAERRRAQGRVVAQVLPRVRDIRRMGSCAIDLCCVASGELDGYYERGVNPWDHAAGGLIAREAGAIVSGLHGAREDHEMLVAAGPAVHAELVTLLENHGAASDD